MKTKNILALALLPLMGMLTACSNDEEQTVADRVPITLSAYTQVITETRAAADTALNKGHIESGQTIKVRVSNTGANTWSDYSFDAGANGVMTASGSTPYYPLDDTHVDIVAYYPSFAESPFTVRSDQTTDGGYLASDLMFANNITNQEKTSSPVTLQFAHKMAKVIVDVSAGSGVSTIEEVTLHKVYPEVTFNRETGAVGSAQGSVTSIKMVKEGTASKATGTAAIPAQTIEGELLTVKTNLGTATYKVDSKEFLAGKVYKLKISVNRAAVGAITEVNGWTDTEGVNIGVGSGSPFLTFTVGSVKFKMVFVEGTDDDIALNFDDQTTNSGYNRHPVTLKGISDYYIGQTEVTNALWYAVMGSRPSLWSKANTNDGQPNNGNNYPVVYMSWNEICQTNGFIDKLNDALSEQLPLGMKFALPSEVQWQYAAIGGKQSNGYIYAGSSIWGDSSWTSDNSGRTTHPVATKPANELGLYDMSGNAWELCRDDYIAVSSNQILAKDYEGNTGGVNHAIRGGSWCDAEANGAYLYPSFRYIWNKTNKNYNVGLRVVLQNE